MDPMHYIPDANAFIQPKNEHYHPDICPAYWMWLLKQQQAGVVTSVSQVRKEFTQDSWLARWAQKEARKMFPMKRSQLSKYRLRIAEYAMASGQYTGEAVDKFLEGADPWLIACALHHEETSWLLGTPVVVTNEISSDSKNRIKIPNVCKHFGIKYMKPFEMLLQEKARFVLERK